jgi:hypothetical protein
MEGLCDDCNQEYVTPWFAPNALWNMVIPGRVGFLCPNCFLKRAVGIGLTPSGWELRAEEYVSPPVKSREWLNSDHAQVLLRVSGLWSALCDNLDELAPLLTAYAAQSQSAEVERLKAERDELLEYCKEISKSLGYDSGLLAVHVKDTVERLEAVIIECREGRDDLVEQYRTALQQMVSIGKLLKAMIEGFRPLPTILEGIATGHIEQFDKRVAEAEVLLKETP